MDYTGYRVRLTPKHGRHAKTPPSLPIIGDVMFQRFSEIMDCPLLVIRLEDEGLFGTVAVALNRIATIEILGEAYT